MVVEKRYPARDEASYRRIDLPVEECLRYGLIKVRV